MRFTSTASSPFSAAAVLLLCCMLAACGGTGQTSMVPASAGVQSLQQAVPPAGAADTLSVDAADVMPLVREARAYASPVRGRSLARVETAGNAGTLTHPKDLHNFGGPTVTSMKSYDILVNCAATCWGSPGTFQTNLGASTMIHIVDQYTGATTNNRYTFGGYSSTTYTITGILHDSDVFKIVHAAAKKYGTGGGYGAEFHVFFAKGVNECSAAAGGCYSPAHPFEWTYCAYHGFTTFSDVGHVLYSVEPYQAVNGCEVNTTPVNGQLIDSTSSTLSHETFETITDPDVPSNLAWYNNNFGEIGDICAPASGVSTGNVTLNSKAYTIQPEYSNFSHACKFSK